MNSLKTNEKIENLSKKIETTKDSHMKITELKNIIANIKKKKP